MKKKLYFYLWISPDFIENEAIKIHEYCLRKYINVFDELNFIVAIDDKFDIEKIKIAQDWVLSIVGDKEYSLEVIGNTTPRECNMLFSNILPKIVNNDKDLCFIAHSKGITDVNMHFRNKWSVSRWLISMYYYCLNDLSLIDEFSNNDKYSMYGAHLTHFKNHPNTNLLTHGTMYCGNFYWIKPNLFNKNSIFSSIYPREETHRFLAENLPLYVNKDSLYGPNNGAIIENTIADLYYLKKDKWGEYLENYGDAEEAFEFQNEVLTKTLGETGY